MTALKTCLSAIAFIIVSAAAHAQRYDSLLTKLNREYAQEKLHLHFDRPVYNPGETIWFKAYLFAAGNPSGISNTLYAEMLDINGKVIQRRIVPVVLSGGASSFDIPADINSATVFVRAYTKWMLNFDSTFIYTKAIPITNINGKKIPEGITGNSVAPAVRPLFYLQFFAEGGDMVQGIESRVAFKATNDAGMPVNINGDIVDGSGKKITSFTSAHDGMGMFLLQPQTGEQYKAIWLDPSGERHETFLNAARSTGVTLQLNSYQQQVEFIIKRPEGLAAPYPYVNIVAQMNGILLYRARVNIGKETVTNNVIVIKDFPAGIVQVTLFTPDAQPVAERLVFINQEDRSFNTIVTAALSDTGKRKKNVIQIEVPDTLLSNLSVAITDADLTGMHTDDNIFSRVLLTSDIRGYVHNPAYYFSGDADSVLNHLDLVMMTNGWRRFKWGDMLAGKWPTLRYRPENYLSFAGEVSGLKEKELLNQEVNVIISHKNGNKQYITTKVLPDGKFVLPQMLFFDTARFFYQFNDDKNKILTSKAKFIIKNHLLANALPFLPDSRLFKNPGKVDTMILRKNEEVYRQLTKDELQKVKTLKPVILKVRKKSKKELMDEEYTSGFFSGGDSRIYWPENDRAFQTSQDVLSYAISRLPDIRTNRVGDDPFITSRMNANLFIADQIRTSMIKTPNTFSNEGYRLPTGNEERTSWRGIEKTYYLNEIQVTAQDLRMIPMSNVAMIKIIRSPFFSATSADYAIIAVYLKRGLDPLTLQHFNVQGYTTTKEFYSPDYSTNSFPDDDYRTTLYWNPFVITDKNKKSISIPFYNNDFTKKMKVIIEGCNENGQLTRVEKIL